ncbi:MAG TPA: helix-turn-helix domain-containing protein [Pyrinomonadaceae bacterium]|nr:helix-turn-helix domain-containing protein [Pyrinomonadaceae bacterium]
MFNEGIPNEYRVRINEVVNFILHNLSEELSLQQLAEIAQYSPFHFQKIFKQTVGESPKQYVIRMRLETAAHALIMHRHKTVTEIALENGFSSSATFARSFKKYFGNSAEEFRSFPNRKNIENNREKYSIQNETVEVEDCLKSLNIRVERKDNFRFVFVNAKLHDEKSIQNAFRKVSQIAETHDLSFPNMRFAGAVYLHSEIYRAMIIVDKKVPISKHLNVLEIPAGKFVILDLFSGFKENMEKLKIFVEFWIPKSGYRISDIVGYEFFTQSPLEKPYHEIKKELYIPIEPIV